MLCRLALLVYWRFAQVHAAAQSTCPLRLIVVSAKTHLANRSPNSHIDVIRQPDGSYTGFEATDAVPYRTISVTPHFERQFAACLPHTVPTSPSAAPPVVQILREPDAQLQVPMAVGSANFFVATISADLAYRPFRRLPIPASSALGKQLPVDDRRHIYAN